MNDFSFKVISLDDIKKELKSFKNVKATQLSVLPKIIIKETIIYKQIPEFEGFSAQNCLDTMIEKI